MNILIILITIALIILFPYLISGLSGAPFFPTSKDLIRKALRLANVKKDDHLVDLGSGDGRFLFEASKYCNNITGLEIHPILVFYTRLKIILKGYKNIKIIFKDFWSYDLCKCNVIFVFLRPCKMKRLEKKIINEVKKGTKIISYAFKFPNLKYELRTKDGLYLYEV